jgi:beta-lactamase regulating signal transducer with metallopeptidase domain/peroxiredoxin
MLRTVTNALNSWADAWSGVMLRNTVDSAVLLVVVGLIWLLLRRRISSQLTIGLFSLVLLKLAVPLPMVLPGSLAQFWPSPRMASDLVLGAVRRPPSSTEAVSQAGQVPDERSRSVQTASAPARSPVDLEPLKMNSRREATSSASPATTIPETPAALAQPVEGQPARGERLTTTAIVMLSWAAIVAVLIARLIRTNLSFFLKVRKARDVDPAALPVDWRGPAGYAGSIAVMEIEDLSAPAAWGLVRPRILMPSGLIKQMHPQSLTWVLLHELMHIRRGDLWLNFFERLVQIAYFFHPAVCVATRVINVQREFACDDAALAVCRDVPREECGSALLWVAEQAQAHRNLSAIGPAQGLFGPYAFLQQRLLRILDTKRVLSSRLSKSAAVILAGLAVLTLPYVQAQNKIEVRRAKQEISVLAKAPEPQPVRAQDVTEKATEPQVPRSEHATEKANKPQVPASKNVTEDAKTMLRTMEIRLINSRTNQPEPGVTIRASFNINAEGITDANGQYRLTATASRFRILALKFQKPGFVPLQVMWDNSMAETPVEIPSEYTVKLEPGSTIGGIVQDENGKPVVGASVHLSIPSTGNSGDYGVGKPRVALGNFQTNTDTSGRWHCDTVPAKLDRISIGVEHADYLTEGGGPFGLSPALPELYTRNAVVVLKKGLSATGRVTDNAGKPIAGARVALTRLTSKKASTTDAQGRFDLPHLPPGQNKLAIQANGHVPILQEVMVADGMTPVDIRLEAGRAVSGRVLDDENKPIEGAIILFELGLSDQGIWPRATSDRDGRFRLDGIPAAGGSLLVRNKLNPATRSVLPAETDKPLTIIVSKPAKVHVRGSVTDLESGQPIPSFNVVLRGGMMARQPATGGKYEVTTNKAPSSGFYPPLQIRIEAKGYAAPELRTVRLDRDDITVDFKLKKATEVSGLVRAPDGTPARNAELGLRGPSQRIDIGDGRLQDNGVYPIIHTNADGRFTLALRDEASVAFAVHPSGFATKTLEANAGRQNAPIDITLQPWGRVEGVFKIGSQFGRNQRMSLFHSGRSEALNVQIILNLHKTTDDNGVFVFERVIPGMAAISRTVQVDARHGLLSQEIRAVDIKPGEKTRVVIGGVGRPVVGHIEIPADLKAKWSVLQPSGRISFTPKLPKPYDALTEKEKTRYHGEWEKTYQSHAFVIPADGSFRVEDIAPGTYELTVKVNEDYKEDRFNGFVQRASISRIITVSEIPGGQTRTDQPLDLGSIPLELDQGVKVGDLAPDIQAQTLDNQKPLKLSDDRGKYVLVVFWNSSTTLRRVDAGGLTAVYDAFGKDDRLLMLGLNADTQGDEAKTRAAQYGWTWLQAKLGSSAGWELRQKYGAYTLPSIWLIGRDGKVVARDLRDGAIFETVARALSVK